MKKYTVGVIFTYSTEIEIEVGADSFEEARHKAMEEAAVYPLYSRDFDFEIDNIEEQEEEYEEPDDIDDDCGFDPYTGEYTWDC